MSASESTHWLAFFHDADGDDPELRMEKNDIGVSHDADFNHLFLKSKITGILKTQDIYYISVALI